MKKLYLFSLLLFSCYSAQSQCCSNGINLLANYNPDFSAPFIDVPPGFITANPYTFFPTPGTYIIVPSRNYGACFSTPQNDHTTGDPINGRFLWSDSTTLASLNVSNSGIVWVEASNGPCTTRDSISLEFNSTPFLELGNDTTICQGENITLTSGFASTYLWSNGSNSSAIDITAAGLYWLQLNNGECFTRDSIIVTTEECAVVIELPNSFTPNNDGFNDTFVPYKYIGIERATLRIYNRWGSEIFYTDNLAEGWNGNYKNNSCTEGTYYWIIQYTTNTNTSKELVGFINLMR